jgi:hypothetical protein
MSHLMPTDYEIREWINNISDSKYRLAFMYQYLIAGRISEVAGKYGPVGNDAIKTDFDGESAVMFIVKTAKRKGRLRGCAVPLNPEYEPWAQEVYDYMVGFGSSYPFRFAEKWSTSIRYMQWEATKAFESLEWPMIGYTVKESKEAEAVKVPERWNKVTSHVMRKRRATTLMWDYDFTGIDLALYGGWTESSAESMPQALKHYLYVDTKSTREPLKLLKRMARRYFGKLCRPYEG